MARISGVRGPASTHVLPSSLALVPGMVVSRHYGQGTLLVSGHAQVTENGGGGGFFVYEVLVDGAILGTSALLTSLAASAQVVAPFSFIHPVGVGVHTIELFSSRAVSTSMSIQEGRAELIVVELPEWDDDIHLVIL